MASKKEKPKRNENVREESGAVRPGLSQEDVHRFGGNFRGLGVERVPDFHFTRVRCPRPRRRASPASALRRRVTGRREGLPQLSGAPIERRPGNYSPNT